MPNNELFSYFLTYNIIITLFFPYVKRFSPALPVFFYILQKSYEIMFKTVGAIKKLLTKKSDCIIIESRSVGRYSLK